MRKQVRKNKIFIDYLRNQRGATAIASYSTRNRPGCTVAVPVSWDELLRIASPDQFTTGNVPQRLAKLKRDPWAGFLSPKQRLTASMLAAAKDFAGSAS
jgi:bifunctional non-homologous end joining protein LigD